MMILLLEAIVYHADDDYPGSYWLWFWLAIVHDFDDDEL
jgi:hypothetical protein